MSPGSRRGARARSSCCPAASIPPPCSRWRAKPDSTATRCPCPMASATRPSSTPPRASRMPWARANIASCTWTSAASAARRSRIIHRCAVSAARPAGEGIPVTYVPARNTIMLSLALAWAEVLDAREYPRGRECRGLLRLPDCRPEFVAAFQNLRHGRHQGGRGGAGTGDPGATDQYEQGRHHPRRARAWAWTTP